MRSLGNPLASSFVFYLLLLFGLKHHYARPQSCFVILQPPICCYRSNKRLYHRRLTCRFASDIYVRDVLAVRLKAANSQMNHFFPDAVDSIEGKDTSVPVTEAAGGAIAAEGGWWKRVAELLEFRNKHGHCQVPKRYAENPTLGNFVNKQRQLYRQYLKGQPCSLTKERVEILDALGFCWNAVVPSKPDLSLDRETFPPTAKLPKRYGSRLPSSEVEPPSLPSSHLSVIEFADTTDSGCTGDWREGFHSKNASRSKQLKWWQRLHEFQAYLQSNNISDLSSIPSSSTWGVWLNAQRNEYWKQKRIVEREISRNTFSDDLRIESSSLSSSFDNPSSPSLLTQEMIQALEDLKIDWNYRRQQVWELRLQQLREYKEEHGDTCVPITYAPNPALAQWISRQRKNYNAKQRGLPTALTQERMEQLDAIGFVWNRWDYEFSRKA